MTNAEHSTPHSSTPHSDQPPVVPVTPAARPQLRRSGSDRMAGGVCGGLAEYSGIDSLLWRVGFVGLTVAGGAGVLVYLLLWVLMAPPAVRPDEPVSALEQLVQRLRAALAGSGIASPRS